MAFDNYVTGAVCAELVTALAGARVERIYQPDREELIICLNRPPVEGRSAGRFNLLISAGSDFPATYITWKKTVNPATPPAFCMMLRKHLIGAKLIAVRQLRRDRIVSFDFMATGELGDRVPLALVAEMMGKHSNAMLLSDWPQDGLSSNRATEHPVADLHPAATMCPGMESRAGGEGESARARAHIIDAIKRVSGDVSRVRQTLPGMVYELPPEGKGMSPLIEKEIEAFPEKNRAYFDDLAGRGDYSPFIYYYDDLPKDFHVFDIGVYASLRRESYDSVSELLDTYYSGRSEAVRLASRKRELISLLSQRLQKAYTKKQRLLDDLTEAEKLEEVRLKGELINANIYRLQQGMSEAELPCYGEDCGEGCGTGEHGETLVKVSLDPRLSPAANAQKYFRRYRKSKTALTEKAAQLKLTDDEVTYLESVSALLSLAEEQDAIAALRSELEEQGYLRKRGRAARTRGAAKPGMKRMKETPPSPLQIDLPSGATIIIGRNNRENDYLTFKLAAGDDIWLHTKDIPGSHVILRPSVKLEGKGHIDPDPASPAAEEIRQAAAYAAHHSKARGTENVPVDYTYARYVKKPTGAKPGMVIFTNNRTIYA
jgi:predicted ribosome quality control (RQC) complex YloA/Tae2 family protein